MANKHGNQQALSTIFSLDATEAEKILGYRPKRDEPVVQAMDDFQQTLFKAAKVVREKRGANPQEPGPLPATTEELVAECGDNWVQALGAKFNYVCKHAKWFTEGGDFPVLIEGREASPYSRLAEGIAKNPSLVKSQQKAFTGIRHFGHPFKKREDAVA